MTMFRNIPAVQLIGEVDHPDFRDAMSALRSSTQPPTAKTAPELIVVAQSRPDAIRVDDLITLQRAAPLAGIVSLLGSWCEGETRTGRPWLGVHRLYWYEFPAWWRNQLQLRAARHCPDWSRPTTHLVRQCVPGHPHYRSGLIVLRTSRRDNSDALADVLNRAGHSTVWQRFGHGKAQARGALAGIWEGGQLNEAEIADLEVFCGQMARGGAPVVALLDFPRRDCVDRAREAGAAFVLGKPYFNVDLLSNLEISTEAAPRRAA